MTDAKEELLKMVKEGNLERTKTLLGSLCLSSKNKNRSKSSYLTQEEKYRLFMEAIFSKNIEIVKFFISNKLNFVNNQHVKSTSTTTPLHVAVHNQDIAMVKLLLENGADLAATDLERQTPLILAAKLNNVAVFKVLLECSKDERVDDERLIDFQGDQGSALHEAVANENIEIISLLLDNNCLPYGLNEAIERENLRIIDHYIDRSPDESERNSDYMLHEAIRLGKKEVVEHLLSSREIDLDAIGIRGQYLLETAIKTSQSQMIDYLFEHGATVGEIPVLTFAIESRRTEILKKFMEMDNAEADLRSMKYNIPLLAVAARAGHADGAKALLAKGADVNQTCAAGSSALHIAVEEISLEIAKILLQHGANVNARREMGNNNDEDITPLHIAVNNGDVEMAKLLLLNHADVTIVGHAMTPVDCAAESGFLELLKLLLAGGEFNGDALDRAKLSATSHAARHGRVGVVKFLLHEGVKLTLANVNNRFSALNLAAVGSHLEVFKLVLEEFLNQGGSIIDISSLAMTCASFRWRKEIEKPSPEGDGAKRKMIEILLSGGADINGIEMRKPPLFHSVSNIFNASTAVFLITRGADFNLKHQGGMNLVQYIFGPAFERRLQVAGVNMESGKIYEQKVQLIKQLIREICLRVHFENVQLSPEMVCSIETNENLRGFYRRCVKEAQVMEKENFTKLQ